MNLIFVFLIFCSLQSHASYLEGKVAATQLLSDFQESQQQPTTWTYSITGIFTHTPSFRSSLMLRAFHKSDFGSVPYLANSSGAVDGLDRPLISAYQLLEGSWILGYRSYFHLGIPAFSSTQQDRTEVLRFWSGELGIHKDWSQELAIFYADLAGVIRTGPPTIQQPSLSTIYSPSLKLLCGVKEIFSRSSVWAQIDFTQYFFGIETNSPIVQADSSTRSASGHFSLGTSYVLTKRASDLSATIQYTQPYYISHSNTVERYLDPLGEGVLGRTISFSLLGEY